MWRGSHNEALTSVTVLLLPQFSPAPVACGHSPGAHFSGTYGLILAVHARSFAAEMAISVNRAKKWRSWRGFLAHCYLRASPLVGALFAGMSR